MTDVRPRPIRVLVVDDREDGRTSLAAALACEGLGRPDLAESGEAALALLESGDYDLVITDLEMPHMTGIELLGCVRARWRTPVILMSASPPSTVDARCGDVRPDGFLEKPIDLDVLVAEVERCVPITAPEIPPRGT